MNKPGGKMTVLVTGFEPFGGSTLNPSQAIAEAMPGLFNGESAFDLKTALLPVDTAQIKGVIDALWREHEPDVVLHFGESAKAEHVTLERVALNLLDFDTPDNAGKQLVDTPIDPSGPAARFVTLPVRSLKQQLAGQGVEARLSLSAGAYLCNQVLYLSLALAAQRGGATVGFVHVPSLVEQVERGERAGPGMAREMLLDAAQRLVRLAATSLGAGPPGG